MSQAQDNSTNEASIVYPLLEDPLLGDLTHFEDYEIRFMYLMMDVQYVICDELSEMGITSFDDVKCQSPGFFKSVANKLKDESALKVVSFWLLEDVVEYLNLIDADVALEVLPAPRQILRQYINRQKQINDLAKLKSISLPKFNGELAHWNSWKEEVVQKFTALGIDWVLLEKGFEGSKTLDVHIGSVFRSALAGGVMAWAARDVPGSEALSGSAVWKVLTEWMESSKIADKRVASLSLQVTRLKLQPKDNREKWFNTAFTLVTEYASAKKQADEKYSESDMVAAFAEAVRTTDSNLYTGLVRKGTTVNQMISAYRLASIATKSVDDPSFQYRILRRVANPTTASAKVSEEAVPVQPEPTKPSYKPERLFLKYFKELQYPLEGKKPGWKPSWPSFPKYDAGPHIKKIKSLCANVGEMRDMRMDGIMSEKVKDYLKDLEAAQGKEKPGAAALGSDGKSRKRAHASKGKGNKTAHGRKKPANPKKKRKVSVSKAKEVIDLSATAPKTVAKKAVHFAVGTTKTSIPKVKGSKGTRKPTAVRRLVTKEKGSTTVSLVPLVGAQVETDEVPKSPDPEGGEAKKSNGSEDE